MTFLAFSERWASADENVADWRCLDCVADMVADVASGRERERRRRVCGDREDLRRSEVRAQAQRSEMAVIENAPQEGDCLT